MRLVYGEMVKMDLFQFACVYGVNVYPEVLGYYYIEDFMKNSCLVDHINNYDFVFIESDFSDPVPGCDSIQFMTSAEHPGTYMWLRQDFKKIVQLPHSEYTEVPTVGFVGRVPIFDLPAKDGDGTVKALHRGFEPRLEALERLNRSDVVCCDFHVRMAPEGDSAGFFNESHPDYRRHAPLFRSNMLANQYQVCARGNANWSLRFFETLASGRIPVYIESGGMTPADWYYGRLQDRIDEIPFVYVKNICNIERDIMKFHGSIDDIGEIQDMCREWYVDYYSHEAQISAFLEVFG